MHTRVVVAVIVIVIINRFLKNVGKGETYYHCYSKITICQELSLHLSLWKGWFLHYPGIIGVSEPNLEELLQENTKDSESEL